MGPTLTALFFVGAGNAVAHAQGTIDFPRANTLMNSFKTSADAVSRNPSPSVQVKSLSPRNFLTS